jgi:hypothetical protein
VAHERTLRQKNAWEVRHLSANSPINLHQA